MSTEITRTGSPARRRPLKNRNTILFPRELRDAIPDLPTYAGRVLELESIDGTMSNTPFFGPLVHVKMTVIETGKLKGRFVVRLGLHAEAARAMAETLMQLADQLDSQQHPGY